MDELLYWIWLSLCCTPDTATFPSLLKKFTSAKDIYNATDSEISSCLNPRSSDRNLLLSRDLGRSEDILKFCRKHNVGIVTYADNAYPASLREIKTPPVLLYYRGILPDFNSGVRIAVVGTRSLSDYGRKNAFTIARDLAISGATVVSGMALGIDGVAAAGAISADKPTVAVLGSGIDVCYPEQHLRLAREIVKKGCILTEYAPSTRPNKHNFPRRNRIISGLCDATVVIEGRERSGAIITARYAKEQGRTVYALPGNVGTKNAEVTNLLIQNGAKLITRADDIVKDFSNGPGEVKLNPFKLEDKSVVNMFEVLSSLSVSCVTPSDDIFSSRPKPQVNKKSDIKEGVPAEAELEATSVDNHAKEELVSAEFNSEILKIYKKIPPQGDIAIESLVDSEFTLRHIMKAMLKLEVGRFVTLLPGDRVKRNLK